MPVELFLLGPPRVEREGQPVAFDTRKALALLAYLAVEGGARSRDQLATFLWPEGDLAHARGALRRTLSSLRKHLNEDELRADRNTVELVTGFDTDRARFNAVVQEVMHHHEDDSPLCDGCLGRLKQAADLYGGPFMEGFELRDSPPFDEWRYLHEESLRKEFTFVLQGASNAYSERGAYREALRSAQRWLELDPLHEPAHVQLIRLHALNDDRTAALEQYRRLVRVLDEELGVGPLESTVALQHAISSGTALKVERIDLNQETARQRPTPFVGRAKELAQLVHLAADVTTGRLIAIEGEAGIGKTRLAHEAFRQTELVGRRVVEVTSHEEERDHPYGLVARLLAVLVEDLTASRLKELDDRDFVEVARLVPEIRPLRPGIVPAPPLDDPGAKTTFFAALHGFLAETLEGQAVLLEDLQWCDPASLDVLAFFLRRLDETPTLVVLTWRTEEVGRSERLRHIVSETGRQSLLDHLVLNRLGKVDVTRIVEEIVPEADAGTIDLIFDESEGLPFFVTEYVNLLAAGGVEDVSLPEDALDLVRARLEPISEQARQVLAAASVLGRSFDLALVQATAGRSDEETVDALDELVGRAIIAEVASGGEPSYDFTHEKIRALAYEETSMARRRLLHGRAADFLSSPRRRARPNDIALAAYHAESAGRESEAATLHIRAAESSRQLFANDEALVHLQRALGLGHPDVAEIHEGIGDMQVLQGAYGRAVKSYETAAAYADHTRIALLERKLADVRFRTGDAAMAHEHLNVALDLTEAGSPSRAHLLIDLGLVLVDADVEQSVASGAQAVEMGEAASDGSVLARAHNLLGLIARRQGRLSDATEHLARSLVAAEEAEDAMAIVAALNNLALARREGGERDEAIALTSRALDLCERRGDVHRAAALHNNLADLLHEEGDEAGSQLHAKEAARLFASVGDEALPPPEIWKLREW